jgi:hypothetical protein
MTKISEDRLRELAEEYGDMAGKLTGELQDGPGAASAFYMSASLGEVASIAIELLSLRTSPPPSGEAGEVKPSAYFIQERDDDMLICAEHWNYGSICVARRPKLATNDEWRPQAQRIVAALEAMRALPTIKEPTDE